MRHFLFLFFISISFSVFGQVPDTVLVKDISRDSLLIDSTLLFQKQLDSITIIVDQKKQELTTLEQQISTLQKKILSLDKKDSLVNISVVSDSLIKLDNIPPLPKQDTILLVKEEKNTTFVEDIAANYGFLFEVLSCRVGMGDTLILQIHIKGPRETLSSPYLTGKISHYRTSSADKDVTFVGNLLDNTINLSSDDNYIIIKKYLGNLPKSRSDRKIVIENCSLVMTVNGQKRKSPPLNSDWEKKKRFDF